MEKLIEKERGRHIGIVFLLAILLLSVFVWGKADVLGNMSVQAATKAGTSKKKTTATANSTASSSKTKAAAGTTTKKKEKAPVLNVSAKTIMKLNDGLLTTYEDYVTYPMNAYTLRVQNKPKKATYAWKTSDEDIVSLSYNKSKGTCRVNAKGGGSAIVTCTVKKKNGKRVVLSSSIKVKNPATSIQIVSEDTQIENMECDLAIDREYQFLANVKSKYTSDKVYWSIQNAEIAQVDVNGHVVPKQVGRTVLTAVAAPDDYDPVIDKYDVVVYAIVINVVEPMEEITNVSVMTTGEVVIQFPSPISSGSVFDINGDLQGVKLGSMSGGAGVGKLGAYLSADKLQLYLVPETPPSGSYKLKLWDLVAENGHRIKDYEETLTVHNSNINTVGANFVSMERTSITIVTAEFDKPIIRPGSLLVFSNKLTTIKEVAGKVGPSAYQVQFTLTPEMQQLYGNIEVELFGYAASGDSSEEGEEKSWPFTFDFTFKTQEEEEKTLDTTNLPLPAPSRITQATETNNIVYIMFGNRIDEESARKIENYRISGGPVVTGAEVVDNSDQGSRVELTIKENSIPEIGTYEFTVSGIKGYLDAYKVMENYIEKVELKDNQPASYKSSSYTKTAQGGQIILEFTEIVDMGSDAKYFDLQASWNGKNEQGVTVNNVITITEYEVKVSGSDNRVVIDFSTDPALTVGTKVQITPINFGGTSGTYLVDQGGNVVQFTSAEVDISY